MKIYELIERHWYHKTEPFLAIILFPLSIVYCFLLKFKRLLFKYKLKRPHELGVPVINIGSITFGSTGKTPLVKYLVQKFVEIGIPVGVVVPKRFTFGKKLNLISASDKIEENLDESLSYSQLGAHIAVGSNLIKACQALLLKHSEIKIIFVYDGLSHYYLHSDLKICVINSKRLFGNQRLFPLGPMCEPMSKLKEVDAIIVNGNYNELAVKEVLASYTMPVIWQKFNFACFYNPHTKLQSTPEDFNGKEVMAMSANGNPYPFFNYLKKLGVDFSKVHTFPEFYQYKETDIPDGYIILTTRNDYTKLAKFNNPNIWVTQVEVSLSNEWLINRIKELL